MNTTVDEMNESYNLKSKIKIDTCSVFFSSFDVFVSQSVEPHHDKPNIQIHRVQYSPDRSDRTEIRTLPIEPSLGTPSGALVRLYLSRSR